MIVHGICNQHVVLQASWEADDLSVYCLAGVWTHLEGNELFRRLMRARSIRDDTTMEFQCKLQRTADV